MRVRTRARDPLNLHRVIISGGGGCGANLMTNGNLPRTMSHAHTFTDLTFSPLTQPELAVCTQRAQAEHSGMSRVRRYAPRVSRRALLKVLLVLVYAQMLVQRADDRAHVADQIELLSNTAQNSLSRNCCGGDSDDDKAAAANAAAPDELTAWFECMWASARKCSGASQVSLEPAARSSRAARYWEWTRAVIAHLLTGAWALLLAGWHRLLSVVSLWHAARVHWLARWRSPIVQRLAQSMLIQTLYTGRMLVSIAHGHSDDFD